MNFGYHYSPWLLVRVGFVEECVRLRYGSTLVGSSPAMRVQVLDTHYVSRTHAEFIVEKDKDYIELRDLKSLNGIHKGGVIYHDTSIVLKHNDRFGLGVDETQEGYREMERPVFVVKYRPIEKHPQYVISDCLDKHLDGFQGAVIFDDEDNTVVHAYVDTPLEETHPVNIEAPTTSSITLTANNPVANGVGSSTGDTGTTASPIITPGPVVATAPATSTATAPATTTATAPATTTAPVVSYIPVTVPSTVSVPIPAASPRNIATSRNTLHINDVITLLSDDEDDELLFSVVENITEKQAIEKNAMSNKDSELVKIKEKSSKPTTNGEPLNETAANSQEQRAIGVTETVEIKTEGQSKARIVKPQIISETVIILDSDEEEKENNEADNNTKLNDAEHNLPLSSFMQELLMNEPLQKESETNQQSPFLTPNPFSDDESETIEKIANEIKSPLGLQVNSPLVMLDEETNIDLEVLRDTLVSPDLFSFSQESPEKKNNQHKNIPESQAIFYDNIPHFLQPANIEPQTAEHTAEDLEDELLFSQAIMESMKADLEDKIDSNDGIEGDFADIVADGPDDDDMTDVVILDLEEEDLAEDPDSKWATRLFRQSQKLQSSPVINKLEPSIEIESSPELQQYGAEDDVITLLNVLPEPSTSKSVASVKFLENVPEETEKVSSTKTRSSSSSRSHSRSRSRSRSRSSRSHQHKRHHQEHHRHHHHEHDKDTASSKRRSRSKTSTHHGKRKRIGEKLEDKSGQAKKPKSGKHSASTNKKETELLSKSLTKHCSTEECTDEPTSAKTINAQKSGAAEFHDERNKPKITAAEVQNEQPSTSGSIFDRQRSAAADFNDVPNKLNISIAAVHSSYSANAIEEQATTSSKSVYKQRRPSIAGAKEIDDVREFRSSSTAEDPNEERAEDVPTVSTKSAKYRKAPPAIIDPPHLPTGKGKLRGVSAVNREWKVKPKDAREAREQIKEERKLKLREMAKAKEEKAKEESKKRKYNDSREPTSAKVATKVSDVSRGAFLLESEPSKKIIKRRMTVDVRMHETLKEQEQHPLPQQRPTVPVTKKISKRRMTVDEVTADDMNVMRPRLLDRVKSIDDGEVIRKDALVARAARTTNKVSFATMEKNFKENLENQRKLKLTRSMSVQQQTTEKTEEIVMKPPSEQISEPPSEPLLEPSSTNPLPDVSSKPPPRSILKSKSGTSQKSKKSVRFNDETTIHLIEAVEGASIKVDANTKDRKLLATRAERRNVIRKLFPLVDSMQKNVATVLEWSNMWLITRNAAALAAGCDVFPVPNQFQDFDHYKSIFMPLMKLEFWSTLDRDYQSFKDASGIPANIETSLHMPGCIRITTRVTVKNERKLPKNSLVIMKMKSGKFQLETMAYVFDSFKATDQHIKIILDIDANAISMENLAKISSAVLYLASDYTGIFLNAIQAIFQLSKTPLVNQILNPQILITMPPSPDRILPKTKAYDVLNKVQNEVMLTTYERIQSANSSVTLIQGPPGTGKSCVITNLVLQCLYGREVRAKNLKVLVCAQSNSAVDAIAAKLLKILRKMSVDHFSVVRFGMPNRINTDISSIILQNMVIEQHNQRLNLKMGFYGSKENIKQQILECEAEIANLKLKNIIGTINEDIIMQKERELKQLYAIKNNALTAADEATLSRQILEDADVVCVTLSSAVKLFSLCDYFDICIIDEATQCIEPWTLFPLKFGITNLVLVGDVQQLPATCLSQKAKDYKLDTSMFARFKRCLELPNAVGWKPVHTLTTQYRMHEQISQWPNAYFYENKLINAKGTEKLISTLKPYSVLSLKYEQDSLNIDGNISNNLEARFVASLLKNIEAILGTPNVSYGVITPYAEQQKMLSRVIGSTGMRNVSINTIDSMQGTERDVIIISVARTNGVGFLAHPQRLNVALTRPRLCLIICGYFNNPRLQSSPVWRNLLQNARDRQIFYECNATSIDNMDTVISKICHKPPKSMQKTGTLEMLESNALAACARIMKISVPTSSTKTRSSSSSGSHSRSRYRSRSHTAEDFEGELWFSKAIIERLKADLEDKIDSNDGIEGDFADIVADGPDDDDMTDVVILDSEEEDLAEDPDSKWATRLSRQSQKLQSSPVINKLEPSIEIESSPELQQYGAEDDVITLLNVLPEPSTSKSVASVKFLENVPEETEKVSSTKTRSSSSSRSHSRSRSRSRSRSSRSHQHKRHHQEHHRHHHHEHDKDTASSKRRSRSKTSTHHGKRKRIGENLEDKSGQAKKPKSGKHSASTNKKETELLSKSLTKHCSTEECTDEPTSAKTINAQKSGAAEFHDERNKPKITAAEVQNEQPSTSGSIFNRQRSTAADFNDVPNKLYISIAAVHSSYSTNAIEEQATTSSTSVYNRRRPTIAGAKEIDDFREFRSSSTAEDPNEERAEDVPTVSTKSAKCRKAPPAVIDPPHLPTGKGKLRGVSAVNREWKVKPKDAREAREQIKEERKQKLREMAKAKAKAMEEKAKEESKKRKYNDSREPTSAKVATKVSDVSRGAFLLESEPPKKIIKRRMTVDARVHETLKEQDQRPLPQQRSTVPVIKKISNRMTVDEVTADDMNVRRPRLLHHVKSIDDGKVIRKDALEQPSKLPSEPLLEPSSANPLPDVSSKAPRRSILNSKSGTSQKSMKSVRFNDESTIHLMEAVESASIKVDANTKDRELLATRAERRNEIRKLFPLVDSMQKNVATVLEWSNMWLTTRNAAALAAGCHVFPVPNQFQDFDHYKSIFMPLMKLEFWSTLDRDYESLKDASGIPANIETSLHMPGSIRITTRVTIKNGRKLPKNSLVIMKTKSEKFQLETMAYVFDKFKATDQHIKIILDIDANAISMENLAKISSAVLYLASDYTGIFLNAIQAIFQLSKTPLMNQILNPQILITMPPSPDRILPKTKAYDDLNKVQNEAMLTTYDRIQSANSSVTLIQGPPGTGKSCVITNLVLQCLYGREVRAKDLKVLVCAQSNSAVDAIAAKLLKIVRKMSVDHFSVVRFGMPNRINPDISSIILQNMVIEQHNRRINLNMGFCGSKENIEQQILECEAEIANLKLKNIIGTINEDIIMQKERELKQLYAIKNNALTAADEAALSRQILEDADVVCVTLSSAVKLFSLCDYFDICIIDEATQCIEPWTLFPLKFGITNLVLVGDVQQLPATCLSQKAKDYKLDTSMFARFKRCLELPNAVGWKPVHTLTTQYRMHEQISQWPNAYFYENKLINAKRTEKLISILKPYSVLSLKYEQDSLNIDGNISNNLEARFVASLLKNIESILGKPNVSYGVITPYAEQKKMLSRVIGSTGMRNVSINTIDSMQGTERDVIIISIARSNGVGFLAHPQRLNVALTRPRLCLIICGYFNNPRLQSSPVWRNLLQNARDRQIFYECNATSIDNMDTVISKICHKPPKSIQS